MFQEAGCGVSQLAAPELYSGALPLSTDQDPGWEPAQPPRAPSVSSPYWAARLARPPAPARRWATSSAQASPERALKVSSRWDKMDSWVWIT